MKKKGFITKITLLDVLVATVFLIVGIRVPMIQDAIGVYLILFCSLLGINIIVDLVHLILSKRDKVGNILENCVIFGVSLKILALFMGLLVFITTSLVS